MKVASKLLVLAALAVGIMLPSGASASTPPSRANFFLDGGQTVNTETGFSITYPAVYRGTSADNHGSKIVGTASFSCTFVTDSTARCRGSLNLGLHDTDVASVSFSDEIISFATVPFRFTASTAGVWARFGHAVGYITPLGDSTATVALSFN